MKVRIPSLVFTLIVVGTLMAGALTPAAAQVSATPTPTRPARPTPRPPIADVTLNVYTAASLTNAFTEIGQQFEWFNPGVKVRFNFAGSQQLARQINEGAPADVFASANQAQMNVAVEGGRITRSQIFVRNRLVVVLPADNPGGLRDLTDLARPGLKLVIAAPAVPVGAYTLDFLTKASADPAFSPNYREAVLANVVSYEDNVRQVFAKVALGEADAGVVYTTDVGADRAKVRLIRIPNNLNTIAEYPIAVVDDSPNAFWARGFVRFVLSRSDGQRLLAKYGFLPVLDLRPGR